MEVLYLGVMVELLHRLPLPAAVALRVVPGPDIETFPVSAVHVLYHFFFFGLDVPALYDSVYLKNHNVTSASYSMWVTILIGPIAYGL